MHYCLILFLILAASLPAAAIELRRGPYLLNQRPDGITIRWRTSDSVRYSSVARYGADPSYLDHAVQAQPVQQHFPGYQEWQAFLSDLEPETKYYYSVEADQVTLAGADTRHFFYTAPPPTSRGRLRFWLFGDSGSNRPREGDIEKVLAMTGPSGPVKVRNGFRQFNQGRLLDGVILLGDNSYPLGTDAQYQTAFFGVYADELCHTPLWPCAGNHDLDGAYPHIFFTNPPEEGQTGLGNRYYYSFDIANAHFVVLEAWKSWWEVTTQPNYLPWQQQLTWLHQDLQSTAQEWIVVVCHFPLYCDGNYDSDTNEPLRLLRETLVPILDQYGVDLYFAGHDHTYQRSYLIQGHTGTRESFDPTVHLKSTSTGQDEPIRKYAGPNGGVIHVISGTGAGTRTQGNFQHPVMVPFDTENGVQRGLATSGSFLLEIEGNMLEGRQIDQQGQVIDHFRVQKLSASEEIGTDQ